MRKTLLGAAAPVWVIAPAISCAHNHGREIYEIAGAHAATIALELARPRFAG